MIDPGLAEVLDYTIISLIFLTFATVAILGIREFSQRAKED